MTRWILGLHGPARHGGVRVPSCYRIENRKKASQWAAWWTWLATPSRQLAGWRVCKAALTNKIASAPQKLTDSALLNLEVRMRGLEGLVAKKGLTRQTGAISVHDW